MWFEAISNLIPIGRVEDVDDLASNLVVHLLASYLGHLLNASFKYVTTCVRVEERFCKRLAIWKRQYISKGALIKETRNFSKGGRITLIQSSMSSVG